MKRLSVVFVVALLASACGGDGGTSPSARVPNYAGNWTGTYTVTGCNQSGQVAIANLCQNIGASLPYSFSLTQSDRNVAGTFALGTIPFGNTGGTVGQDGSLALQGTGTQTSVTIVVNWSLNLPATVLTGTVSQVWTSTGLSGQANVVGTINTSIRSASALAPAPIAPAIGESPINTLLRALTTPE